MPLTRDGINVPSSAGPRRRRRAPRPTVEARDTAAQDTGPAVEPEPDDPAERDASGRFVAADEDDGATGSDD